MPAISPALRLLFRKKDYGPVGLLVSSKPRAPIATVDTTTNSHLSELIVHCLACSI